jgi:hypothetical protein
MIDPSILDEAFSTMSDLKNDLSKVQLTMHEDGYHEYAGSVSDLRLAVELLESKTADLYESMEKGAKQ